MARKFPTLTPDSPRTVAELRAKIDAAKIVARRRLEEHASDATQSAVSRDVCRLLAARMA